MKIVFASSEISPFIKTGGLADVAGALPKYINDEEFEFIAMMPLYGSINRKDFSLKNTGAVSVPHRGSIVEAGLFSGLIPGSSVAVFFLEYNTFFDRKGAYQENGIDYEDNDERFAFFCRGVLEICRFLNFQPDVIHCNDWQTGLIPVYLKTLYKENRFFSGTSVLFTVHNLSYRGLFDPVRAINITGLPWSVFSINGVEFYGMFSFLKGGLYYSDFINTVSPTYSREIQTEESGMGLHGLLQSRSDSLSGIINGIDYSVWDPLTDAMIKKNYGTANTWDKIINSEWLCRFSDIEYDERIPIFGMITRLTEQKGIDLVASVTDEMMKRDLNLIILGTGDEYYHNIFSRFAVRYYGKLSVILRYDDPLSHLIYAGSDMFLMPSRFEPCGLSQLISLRYGTVPVVRDTGGLADTIIGYSPHDSSIIGANGFVFSDYSTAALLECIDRALELFKDRSVWRKIMLNGMNCDFSWKVSAGKYEELYRKLNNTVKGF